MKVHYFQHVPFEGIGSMEEWALSNGHSLSSTKFYVDPTLPDVTNLDLLIIMGGPMSVNDEKKYPWLKDEKQFIRQAVDLGKSVVGVCLGAQLIANAFGAKVFSNREKEIGWFPVRFTENAKQIPSLNKIQSDYTVFHWHGDTFDLPEGAFQIAYSEACKNQAFLYKEKALGLQFHLETTKESLKRMMKYGKDELTNGKFIQSEEEIYSGEKYMESNKELLFSMLDGLS